jgi:membrane-associated phospholipid phosphatase
VGAPEDVVDFPTDGIVMKKNLLCVLTVCVLVYHAPFIMAAQPAPIPAGRAARRTPLDYEYWHQLAPRPRDLWGETEETFRGWNFGYVAATAGLAGGLAFLDADMQKPWRRGEEILGQDITKIGDVVGNPGVQAGVMGLTYTLGQFIGDPTMTQAGKSMAETMIFTSLTTIALKGIFNRERPNGHDHLSFPSWHASATFGNATVLAEYYGWEAGIPAYLIALFVGWTRIEDDSHFVSDVVTGAAIGCIYGHAVSRYSMRVNPSVSIEPVVMEDGPGVRASMRF